MIDPNNLLNYKYDPQAVINRLYIGIFLIKDNCSDSDIENLYELLESEFRPFIEHFNWYRTPPEFKIFKKFIYGEFSGGSSIEDYELVYYVLFKIFKNNKSVFMKLISNKHEVLCTADEDELLDEPKKYELFMKKYKNRLWWCGDGRTYEIPPNFHNGKELSLHTALDYLSNFKNNGHKFPLLEKKNIIRLDNDLEKILENYHIVEIIATEKMFNLIKMNNPNFYNSAIVEDYYQQELENMVKNDFDFSILNKVFPGSRLQNFKILDNNYRLPKIGTSNEIMYHVKLRLNSIAASVLNNAGEGLTDIFSKSVIFVNVIELFLSWNSQLNKNDRLFINFNHGNNDNENNITIDEYNKKVESDFLQKELMRSKIIDKPIKSGEIKKVSRISENFKEAFQKMADGLELSDDENDKIDLSIYLRPSDGEVDPLIRYSELKELEKFNSTEFDIPLNLKKNDFSTSSEFYKNDSKEEIEIEDQNLYDHNNEKEIRDYFKNEGVDIDEDDFFEYVCKKALKLDDDYIENLRNGVANFELKRSREADSSDESDVD